MKNVFLIGSCRIHRPFNCDYFKKNHKDGKYKLYNCLNTLWFQKYFLGSLYESNYIIQILKWLTEREIKSKENINVKPPQHKIDEKQFLELCDALMEADIIIIEIATIKYFIKDYIYLSNEHINYLGITPTESGKLNKDELINNITQIEKLVHDIGKKVLFISHFNYEQIPNRTLIIESLRTTAKHFFDPTCVITSNSKLQDKNHYTVDTEAEIMEEIHNKLSIM